MGGKWTIYRKMGEDTVDEIVKYLRGNNILGNSFVMIISYQNLFIKIFNL